MNEESQRRWRLALGSEDEALSPEDQRVSAALSALTVRATTKSAAAGWAGLPPMLQNGCATYAAIFRRRPCISYRKMRLNAWA
jgi:hypothetical protein